MKHACAVIVLGLALLWGAPSALAQIKPPAKTAGPSFKAMDADKSGHLTLDEVLAYATKKSSDVKPFRISDADLDGDGVLTVEEQHKAGITGLEQFGAVNLKELDQNGDGYISKEDLDEYFRRKNREAYARADADKDGALRPSEFALFRF
ncbi:MAG: EF-hand domain-containing protein [Proteobacteria bacterium]|nr:EF-hand domain-containing protein [Pseudomonadota bacterium]